MVRTHVFPVRFIALVMGMLAMLIVTVAFPNAANAQASGDVVLSDVSGKVFNENGKLRGTFAGQITNPDVSFVNTDRYKGLKISGLLTGTLTKTNGTTEEVSKEFTTKLKATQQDACQILNLDIGRINLNLLGLVVDIAPISIDVTAVPGNGNLLGNLLCAVAGLLDPSNALARFLDNLLGTLFTTP